MIKNQPKKWLHFYFKFLLLLLILIPIFWVLEIQLFPVSIIPLLVLLFVRYLFLSMKLKKGKAI
jgi:hypothetical protein